MKASHVMGPSTVRPSNSSQRSGAFSLVEILVAISVFSLLLILLAAMSEQVMRSWRSASGQTEFYQHARTALDLIARRVTQATLNPYWVYDDPASPQRYLRHSDLRFVIQPASSLLGSGYGPGSAAFFQAPLGRSESPANRQMTGLLNTCGFYIEKSSPLAAPFAGSHPGEARYRLMELLAPAEQMGAFAAGGEEDLSWITGLPGGSFARPIAENIILFLLRPLTISVGFDGELTAQEIGDGQTYNSAEDASNNPQPPTAHQLPPVLEITLVAIDEASAQRFETSNVSFEEDLEKFQEDLTDAGINFRVLQTRISLPNSRWNG